MKRNYEYIVVGCGGIGSGAAYWLARRAGADVLGLEQFEIGHQRGGSQDYSRIIRLTYHNTDYTRLTPHTYTAWATVEEESAVTVVTKTGSVSIARQAGTHQTDIEMYAQAMDEANIPYDRFGTDELMRRFPQFKFNEETDVVWQDESGIADAIKGNAAHIGTARYHGATILDNCPVTAIRPFEGGVEVDTVQGTFTCRRLVLTAGAWLDHLLADVGLTFRLTVTQEQVTYYATPNLREFSVGRFPIFLWHDQEVIYGFPVYGEVGTKAAIDAAGPEITPDTRTYDPDPVREQVVENWLKQHVPGFLGPKMYTKTCLYTMTRDRNFVIDVHPEHPNIIIYNGAGHAYKFASLIGKILSQLAIDGKTEYPIAPFILQRPAIMDPNYEAKFHI